MDISNVVFPMTAADLVVSARILCQQQRGDGPDMRLAEVQDVSLTEDERHMRITLRDTATFEEFVILLKPDTSLLVTGIRRT